MIKTDSTIFVLVYPFAIATDSYLKVVEKSQRRVSQGINAMLTYCICLAQQ